MKSFIKFLSEADALRDKKIRDEGTRVWNKVLRNLKLDDFFITYHPQFDNAPVMVINVGKTIREAKYSSLVLMFIFTQKNYGWGGVFVPMHNVKAIRLIIDDKIKTEVQSGKSYISKNEFSKIIKNPKYLRVFIHEFIHFLDSERIEKFSDLPRGGQWDAGTFQPDQKYYNSPHEFNAFFHQAAKEIDTRIKDIIKMVRQDIKKSVPISTIQWNLEAKIPSDPHNFIKYLPLGFDYKKTLDQKFQKKFMNRLYDYYQKIALPQRTKLIQELEKIYNTSFQKTFEGDLQEVLELLRDQIQTAQEAIKTQNRNIFLMVKDNIYVFFVNFSAFHQAVMKHRTYFQFSKAMVDSNKTNFVRELQTAWRKIEPLSKHLGNLLARFEKEN